MPIDSASFWAAVISAIASASAWTCLSPDQTPRGQGHKALREGWVQKDGRLPVNPSGGLKAKGHPVGATGVSMHVMACMQLAGEAAGMQIPGAALAGVFNMGGAAVANYVSILERAK